MKIAALQSYEILFSKNSNNFFHIVINNHPEQDFFHANIRKDKLITIDYKKTETSDEELIKIPNFLDKLKEKKIDTYYINTLSLPPIEKWAKKNKIKLLSPSWTLQRTLEDKIFFDKLLKKNKISSPFSIIPKKEKDIVLITKFPGVVQAPYSHGSQGTFLVKDKKGILELLKDKKIKFPFLYREFIKGIPIGVTLLLSKKEMIFSSIRGQAIMLDSKNTNKYLGIQWMKTSEFKKEGIKNLNKTLVSMGKVLQKMKLYGTASIDLIIRDNDVFVIECNPRLSLSSIQISQRKELLHGYDFNEEFIKGLTGKKLSANKPFVPNTTYEGCTLDLDFFENKLSGKKTKRIHKVGMYEIKNGTLKYLSNKTKEFKNKNIVFIDHKLKENTVLNQEDDYGMAIAHQPVVKIEHGTFSIKDKNKILSGIEKLLLSNIK
ncbi:MAG: ATP-grasp domain-containing protein [Candidatus Peregrinibacteria bacterium]|nr:ATP-grasp domain-containing protein [Candidatus Peregrinibacteria bacterium]